MDKNQSNNVISCFSASPGKPVCHGALCAINTGDVWKAITDRKAARESGRPEPIVSLHIRRHLDEVDADMRKRLKDSPAT